MACNYGQFNVDFKTFSINLNVLDVDGLTPFDLVVWLLDTLEYK